MLSLVHHGNASTVEHRLCLLELSSAAGSTDACSHVKSLYPLCNELDPWLAAEALSSHCIQRLQAAASTVYILCNLAKWKLYKGRLPTEGLSARNWCAHPFIHFYRPCTAPQQLLWLGPSSYVDTFSKLYVWCSQVFYDVLCSDGNKCSSSIDRRQQDSCNDHDWVEVMVKQVSI